MEYRITAKILGMKKFKGDVEGNHYDTTTLFIETKLDDRRGNGVGYGAAELKFGTSENFDKLKHLTFPITGELVVEDVLAGERIQRTVIDLKPMSVDTTPPSKKAA